MWRIAASASERTGRNVGRPCDPPCSPWRRGLVLALGLVASASAIELRLIGVRVLEPGLKFQGARVGGLSGIDYDRARDRWIAVSDAKADEGGARAYTLELDYGAAAVGAVRVVAVTPLAAGDVEAVRIDPRDGGWWIAGEGEAAVSHAAGVFVVRAAGRCEPVPLPWAPASVRANRSFESLAFAADGESLWIGLEAPRLGDGEPPTLARGATTRLARLDRAGRVLAQVPYALDAWPIAPASGKLADNGLAELLALPNGDLLALERAGAQDERGAWRFTARIYGTAPGGGKRLVYDFARSGQPRVDNLEGLAWGRRLPNGHATLVVVSDDNFSANQETQFWIFEAIPSL